MTHNREEGFGARAWKGFDLDTMREKAVSEKKFGLFSIIERIKYIGGEVNIDSLPKKGTKVVIDIPIVS